MRGLTWVLTRFRTWAEEIWFPTEKLSYRTPALRTIPSYSQRSWTNAAPSGL